MIDEKKDWLSDEIKYESKISAWDMDEPGFVKRMHEENCPREKLSLKHIKEHSDNIVHSSENIKSVKEINFRNKQANDVARVFAIILVIIFLLNLFFM